MSDPFVARPAEGSWEDLGAGGTRSEVMSLVGPEQSDSIAAGLCLFEDSSFDWRLVYDEVIHILEGTVEVQTKAGVLRGEEGDVMFLPNGSEVTYVFKGVCRLFFCAYPADWQARLERADA